MSLLKFYLYLKDKWSQHPDGMECFRDIGLMALDSTLKCAFSFNSNCQTNVWVSKDSNVAIFYITPAWGINFLEFWVGVCCTVCIKSSYYTLLHSQLQLNVTFQYSEFDILQQCGTRHLSEFYRSISVFFGRKRCHKFGPRACLWYNYITYSVMGSEKTWLREL